MRWLVFHAVLKPLIRRNYHARAAGALPDQWYWADDLAMRWGYYLDLP